MAKYYIEVSSAFTLDEISRAVNDEELLMAIFRHGVVSTNDGQVVNLMTMEEQESKPKKPIKFVDRGQEGPKGTSKIWSGTLLAQGSIKHCDAYR